MRTGRNKAVVGVFQRPMQGTIEHNSSRRAPARAGLVGAAIAVAGLLAPAAAAAASAAPEATDVSREAGIYEVNHTMGAYVADYDGDGWDDLLVNRHYGDSSRLYLNDAKGGFTETLAGTLRRRDRGDCDFADVNGDGRIDLYCTVGGKKGGTGPNPNELWIQQPDGTLVNEARSFGVTNRFGRGRDTKFIDANGDSWPDLFVGNAVPRKDGRRGGNKLFINRDGERFSPARGFGLNRPVGGEDAHVVDFDGDGRDDLLLCGKKRLHLYRNVRNERFVNATDAIRKNRRCAATLMEDMDGDGRLDLVRVSRGRLTVLKQAQGRFRRVLDARPLEGGRALAAGDVDGDGLPDLYVVQSGRANDDEPDVMLVNRRSGRKLEEIDIPQTREGVGDAVTAIDYDRNGRSDFVVLNGHRKAEGPIRLIAFGR